MNIVQTRKSGGAASVVNAEHKLVNLALQGGGNHGAFTWGVLDRLLEDGRLSFDGITASSAGAINATVLAYGLIAGGLIAGGPEGAREALRTFWSRISGASMATPIPRPSLFDNCKAISVRHERARVDLPAALNARGRD